MMAGGRVERIKARQKDGLLLKAALCIVVLMALAVAVETAEVSLERSATM